MELEDTEIRVLGCLIEKELTTPDHYPLTTNALLAACNQKSNRDPVVDYDERTVDAAMLSLREQGLARTITGSGRSLKHRHVLAEALQVDQAALALLGVLALRGPQTVGELRTRTERANAFTDLDQVNAALEQLAARPEPLVVDLGRQPGQKESRWAQLLRGSVAEAERAVPPPAAPRVDPDPNRAELSELRDQVAELARQVATLFDLLGEQPPG